MNDLVDFIQANDGLDPLLRMAIAHHQFESIHPFYDGNGRTGRILNLLILQRERLLDLPVLYLSRIKWHCICIAKLLCFRRLQKDLACRSWKRCTSGSRCFYRHLPHCRKWVGGGP